jgi:hypothetical protein
MKKICLADSRKFKGDWIMKYKTLSVLLAATFILISILACASSAPAGISNIYMASDEAGKNKTSTFASNDVAYIFFDVNQVDKGAQFHIKWFALNVDGQDPKVPFLVTDYTYNGESTIYAQIKNTEGGFPAGQYKAEIYLADVKVGEQLFTIQ